MSKRPESVDPSLEKGEDNVARNIGDDADLGAIPGEREHTQPLAGRCLTLP